MSRSLCTIIPHSFRNHDDREAVRVFIYQIVAKIADVYGREYKGEDVFSRISRRRQPSESLLYVL